MTHTRPFAIFLSLLPPPLHSCLPILFVSEADCPAGSKVIFHSLISFTILLRWKSITFPAPLKLRTTFFCNCRMLFLESFPLNTHQMTLLKLTKNAITFHHYTLARQRLNAELGWSILTCGNDDDDEDDHHRFPPPGLRWLMVEWGFFVVEISNFFVLFAARKCSWALKT